MVEIDLLRLDPDLPVPGRAHPGDAGLDLCAREDVELAPGERALVPTGVAMALPEGHVGLVCPRSGLAAREGLGLLNAPGVIDAGYRGEIHVCLVNHDPRRTVRLRRGDRVAQLVVQRVELPRVRVVESLPDTARGGAGFGSSGGWQPGDPAVAQVADDPAEGAARPTGTPARRRDHDRGVQPGPGSVDAGTGARTAGDPGVKVAATGQGHRVHGAAGRRPTAEEL